MNVHAIIHRLHSEERSTPFAWGISDCVTLAAAAAIAITGSDPIERFRGRYSSATGAARLLLEEGWRDLGDFAASVYPEIHPAMARTGDWAWIVNEDGTDTFGIVCGSMALARLPIGLGQVPLSRIKRAFEVRP